jgi:hypothetical protein
MDFLQKNRFIVKHRGAAHFDADLLLYRNRFPCEPLKLRLNRANRYNRGELDGWMLFRLPDCIGPEKILRHRE